MKRSWFSTVITVFPITILVGLAPQFAHARWDVARKATVANELPDTRLFSKKESRVLGYSILTRTIPTQHGDLGVATITNSVLKKDKATDVSIEAMAEGVREALSSPQWTREVNDGVTHFTAAWPKKHLFLRLAIRGESDRWLISFSNVRDPFREIASEETDILQRAFFVVESKIAANANKGAKSHKRSAMFDLMIPRADAVSTQEVLNITRGFQNYVRGITDNVGLNSAKELSGAISGLSGEVSSTISTSTNQIGADIKSSAHELSDTVKKTISFKNGFMFGIGVGVGTAVGTIATNFVIDGTASLARTAWYALIGRMKPEERARIEARASKSFDDFVTASEKMNEIENDLSIIGMAATEAVGQPGVALAELSEAQAFQYRDQMDKLRKSLAEAKSPDQVRECSNALAQYDALLRYKEAMRPIFQQNPTLPKICERIETLLENWKIAEAQLHQAKMVVASEVSTLLNNVRSSALDALPEDVSSRQRINECEARVDQLVSRHKELFKLSECDKPTAANGVDADACRLYSSKIAAQETTKAACTTDVKASLSSVSPQSLNRSMELMDDQIGIFRKRFSGIIKADCREGEKSTPCDGKVGDLEVLREHYRSRVTEARKACPNMNLVASDSGVNKTASINADAATTSRSPASIEASGQTPESTGFFSRIWTSIKNFFTSSQPKSSAKSLRANG